MLFNSLPFLVFFPIAIIIFFLLRHKYRWAWLLIVSCFFYMFFKPVYILILAFTIIIDYYAALKIETVSTQSLKKLLLIISLSGNILVLAIFKYYNFLNDNITEVMSFFNIHNPIPYLKILLPIGLSFHTFQAMSYIIEVYRGNQKAEKHLGYYSLYVMFFPQLVAGPIERPQNILHQFHEQKTFQYSNLSLGLKMMVFGLFKKVVIADNIAQVVNNIFDFHSNNGLLCIVAMCLFSIQIYCDFSGYSDLALGTAKCMGFDLMINFSLPYTSRSVTEFWRRWHISLSTWFRDYVYIPLGGNTGTNKVYVNLLIIFLLSGLWHGASWNFIIWGAIHAFLLIFEKIILLKLYKKVPDFILVFWNFLLITITWLLFRVESFEKLVEIASSISQIQTNLNSKGIIEAYRILGSLKIIFTLINVSFFLLIDKYFHEAIYFQRRGTIRVIDKYKYHFLVAMILVFCFVGEVEFIYFQF